MKICGWPAFIRIMPAGPGRRGRRSSRGPGPALVAVTRPLCSSAIRLTIDNPRPVELSPAVGFADRRWNRPNSRVVSSGESPGPRSRIAQTASPASRSTVTSMRSLVGLYLMALPTRLSIASRRRSWSALSLREPSPERTIFCSLRSASGRLEATTSATRAAKSMGSRRIEMSRASFIASTMRSSTIDSEAPGGIADVVDLRAHRFER